MPEIKIDFADRQNIADIIKSCLGDFVDGEEGYVPIPTDELIDKIIDYIKQIQ